VGAPNLTNATAIVAGALVNTNNTLVLGRSLDVVKVPGAIDIFGPVTGQFVLGVGNGGTGLNSSGGAGNYLRSNGTIWTSSPLLTLDIPSGSNHYIQNTTGQQSANFSISGNGVIAGTLGVGTTAPASGFTLDVAGGLRAGSINVTGGGFVAGNLGIGTTTPTHKLDVAGSLRTFGSDTISDLTVENFGGSGSAAWLRLKTVGRSWVLGTTRGANGSAFYIDDESTFSRRMTILPNNGLIRFNTDNMSIGGNVEVEGKVGIGIINPTAKLHVQTLSGTVPGIQIDGNAVQSSGIGWAKALLFVDGGGTIHQCYNGRTGVSLTGGTTNTGCGFTVRHPNPNGQYFVDFDFSFDFAVATAKNEAFGSSASVQVIGNSTVFVQTIHANSPILGEPNSFFLVVF
jgi:hypothetical protein